MRKVKRFAAIVLTVALLSPTTAYAGNVEDAKALYEQVTEKQKSVTDMNAYYDYQIHLSGSALEGVEDLSNMRLEMNVRMNHLTDMGNLQYSSYSRVTMPGQEPVISVMYYKDGTSYMDAGGMKIKYPVDLSKMAEQISSQTFLLASGQEQEELLNNFRLWTEGDNQVVGFVIQGDKMTDYMDQVLNGLGMGSSLLSESSVNMKISDIPCEYVIDPNGDCIKMRMKMNMGMNVDGKTANIDMDGDVGIADPGSPVGINFPNLSEYKDMAEAFAR